MRRARPRARDGPVAFLHRGGQPLKAEGHRRHLQYGTPLLLVRPSPWFVQALGRPSPSFRTAQRSGPCWIPTHGASHHSGTLPFGSRRRSAFGVSFFPGSADEIRMRGEGPRGREVLDSFRDLVRDRPGVGPRFVLAPSKPRNQPGPAPGKPEQMRGPMSMAGNAWDF